MVRKVPGEEDKNELPECAVSLNCIQRETVGLSSPQTLVTFRQMSPQLFQMFCFTFGFSLCFIFVLACNTLAEYLVKAV